MIGFMRILYAVALSCTASLFAEEPPPKSWVDPDTGHRVIRLTEEPNSASLYFNQNWFTADGKRMVYSSPTGIFTLDLATKQTRHIVAGRLRLIEAGRKTNSVFFIQDGAVQVVNADTGERRQIAKLPPRGSVDTVNADETLIAGTYTEAQGLANNPYAGSQRG